MIGCKKSVKTIAGVQLDLDIRAGIESGAEFASHGNGFPNVNNPHIKGRFVSIVRIRTPSVTDPVLVEQLKTINDAINNAP
jgi:DnaJ-class molecular chaperone